MEPHIQYTKTSDGVSIAYWTMGEGPPLVYMPMIPLSHLQVEWQLQEFRGWYEQLSQDRMIVRYDNRGSGLSDRIVSDYSPKALVRDLEAVVERLKLGQFALMGLHRSGPIAMAYAANNPGRITRLILWCTWARTASYFEGGRFETLRKMLEGDWQLLTETIAREFAGWSGGPLVRAVAEWIRQSTTQEVYRAILDASDDFDVSPFLPQIRCPALILHANNVPLASVELARRVAAGIADARLALVDGEALLPFIGDHVAKLQTIDEFLRDEEAPTPPLAPDLPHGTAIILFADIADSTALTERLGDAAFRDKARELDEALRRAITSNGGTAIEGKLLGDGVLATFGAAREAIACASELHHLASSQSSPPPVGEGLGEGSALLLHIGIHAGDVIREANNVYGGAVNIASRICALAGPGEVLVSRTVADLARTSAGVSFEDRGEQALKGIGETVRVWAVRSQ